MKDGIVHQEAERFWRAAGKQEPFPRRLESAILWALPLMMVKLPRLAFGDVRQWMVSRSIRLAVGQPDQRLLRGCLVARAGMGIIFVDGADRDDEQRLSLAHEVAHFILDHLAPRKQALAALGESVREVLDGIRPPSAEERLNAILAGVQVGTLTHLMDRTTRGDVARQHTLDAEDQADRLALELLAPWSDVIGRLKSRNNVWPGSEAADRARVVLVEDFGLPSGPATAYAAYIVRHCRPHQSFREWIGL